MDGMSQKGVAAIDNDFRETISVVIPTRNRPQLVSRAVKSVLSQTYNRTEVIVVVDGPDETTVRALSQVHDLRLRTVALPTNVGPADARNAGVNEARGTWIALLDDDDEWLPQKLEIQTRVASRSPYAFPIVTCRFIARTPRGEFVWPRRAPTWPLSDYLMARRGVLLGEGWIGAPTLLTKKALLQEIPFTSGLWVHEDWDWLLRASMLNGVGIEFVPEPLVICYIQESRESASTGHRWRRSLEWIRKNRHLVTPRAYAGFVMTVVGPAAAREGDWKAFLPLLQEALRSGKPQPIDFLLYMGMWLVPQEVRRSLRALLASNRRT
jgi:glycosyltransferase involved in cell wall biosynthesis